MSRRPRDAPRGDASCGEVRRLGSERCSDVELSSDSSRRDVLSDDVPRWIVRVCRARRGPSRPETTSRTCVGATCRTARCGVQDPTSPSSCVRTMDRHRTLRGPIRRSVTCVAGSSACAERRPGRTRPEPSSRTRAGPMRRTASSEVRHPRDRSTGAPRWGCRPEMGPRGPGRAAARPWSMRHAAEPHGARWRDGPVPVQADLEVALLARVERAAARVVVVDDGPAVAPDADAGLLRVGREAHQDT